MRRLLMLLPMLSAALLIADTHGAVTGQVDFSAFKTFVVRQSYTESHETSKPENVPPKLSQAVRDALRSTLSARGIKEAVDSADLLVNFRVEVATQRKEATAIVVVELINTATDTTIWHGQHIDNDESATKLEKRLPDAIRKMLSENPQKKK